jgi:hypothetical protein
VPLAEDNTGLSVNELKAFANQGEGQVSQKVTVLVEGGGPFIQLMMLLVGRTKRSSGAAISLKQHATLAQ